MLENLVTRFKISWKKEYIVFGIIGVWTFLCWEGYLFFPGAKWIGSVIPLWLVIINLVLYFVFFDLLVNKTSFSSIGFIATMIGIMLTLIFLRIGYNRFPTVSIIGVYSATFLNMAWKKWRSKGGRVDSK